MTENVTNTGQFNKLPDKNNVLEDSTKNFYNDINNDINGNHIYNKSIDTKSDSKENIYPNVIPLNNSNSNNSTNSTNNQNVNLYISSFSLSSNINHISPTKSSNIRVIPSQFKNKNIISPPTSAKYYINTSQRSTSLNPNNYIYNSITNKKENEIKNNDSNENNETITDNKKIVLNSKLNSNTDNHSLSSNTSNNENSKKEKFSVPPRTTSNVKPSIPQYLLNKKDNNGKNFSNNTSIDDKFNIYSNDSIKITGSNSISYKEMSYNNSYPNLSYNSNSKNTFEKYTDKNETQLTSINYEKKSYINSKLENNDNDNDNADKNNADFNLRPYSLQKQDLLPYINYNNYNNSSSIINTKNSDNENLMLESIINNTNPFILNNKNMPYQINDTPISNNSDMNNPLINKANLNDDNTIKKSSSYNQSSKSINENSSLNRVASIDRSNSYTIFYNNMDSKFNTMKSIETDFSNKDYRENIELQPTNDYKYINNGIPSAYNDNENFNISISHNVDDDKKPLKESLLNANFTNKNKNRISRESSSSSSLSRLNSIFRNVSLGRSKRYSNSSMSINSIITRKSLLGKLSGSESKNGYNMINNENTYEDYIDEDIANDIKTSDYLYKKAKSLEYVKHNKIEVLPSGRNNDNASDILHDKNDMEYDKSLKRKSISSPDLKINNRMDSSSSQSNNKKCNYDLNERKNTMLNSTNSANSNTFSNNIHKNNNENYLRKDKRFNERDFLQSSTSTKTSIYDDTNPFAIDISNPSNKINPFNSRISVGSNNNFIDISKIPKIEEDKELERLKIMKRKRKKRDRRRLNKKQKSITIIRIIWVFLCRCVTFFVPDFVLSFFKLHERSQPLWREKITILLLYGIVTTGFFISLNIGNIPTNFDIFNREKVIINGHKYNKDDLDKNNMKEILITKNNEDISYIFPTYTTLEHFENNKHINTIVYDRNKLKNYLSYRKDNDYISKINNPSLKCPKTSFNNYSCYDYQKLKDLRKTGKYCI